MLKTKQKKTKTRNIINALQLLFFSFTKIDHSMYIKITPDFRQTIQDESLLVFYSRFGFPSRVKLLEAVSNLDAVEVPLNGCSY